MSILDIQGELLTFANETLELRCTDPALASCGPYDHMYTHWYKKIQKGKHTKVRWLSAVTDTGLKRCHELIARHVKFILSPSVHSYRRQYSCSTCASAHVGAFALYKLDISDFFPSITEDIVKLVVDIALRNTELSHAMRDTMSRVIAEMCTITDPRPHMPKVRILPLGIPPSANISNSVLATFDLQVASMCEKERIVYSRYSDNLYFSKKDGHIPKEFQIEVCSLLENYTIAGIAPFRINRSKTKYLGYWRQQRMLGVVVNKKVNVPSKFEARLRSSINHIYWDFLRLSEACTTGDPSSLTYRAALLLSKYSRVRGYVSYLAGVNRDKYMKYYTMMVPVSILMRYVTRTIGERIK